MIFSNQDLKKIIIPLVIEQFLTVTIGMLDTVMVAHAGESAVAGVSLVDSVNLLMVYIFTALASGGAVVISQFMGAGKMENANKAAKQLVWAVFAVAFFIMMIMLVFRKGLLAMIFGSITNEVMASAQIYFLFTALSYPFLAFYNAGASIFRAMGNSKISMNVSLMKNLINLFGNALLIYVFNMGSAGAGISTLFSRIIGAGVIMYLVHDKTLPIHIERLFSFKPDFRIIRRICGIGIPHGAENGMFQFGKVITQSLISSMGTVALAANAAASGLVAMQYAPSGAMGTAMTIVVSRCVGAEEKEQAKKYVRKLLGIAYALMASIAIIMAVFSKPLVGLYGLSAESAAMAQQLLVVHSIVLAIIHPVAFCLTSSFRAANDVRYTMIISVISMWTCRVGLSYVFGKYMGMGVMGVWIAMMCDWVFRAIFFGIRFIRGTWLTKYKAIETN